MEERLMEITDSEWTERDSWGQGPSIERQESNASWFSKGILGTLISQ